MMDVSFVNKNWLYKICLVCSIIVAWPDLFLSLISYIISAIWSVKKVMIYIEKPSPQKVEEETSFDFACPNLLDFGFFYQTKKAFSSYLKGDGLSIYTDAVWPFF